MCVCGGGGGVSMFNETTHSVFVRERLLPCRVAAVTTESVTHKTQTRMFQAYRRVGNTSRDCARSLTLILQSTKQLVANV